MSLWRNHFFLQEMKDSVNYAQYKRLIKIVQDEFYLLETKYEDLTFKICGSTKNVYTIIFDKSEHKFKCNCPDMSSHCVTHNCLCKHIVFVLIRVLKYTDTDVYKDLKWDNEKMEPYFEKLNSSIDSLITNTELSEKYKSKLNLESKKDNDNNKFSCNTFNKDYECAICYDIMDIKDDKDKFVGCPTCKQSFHKLCIKRWLENAVHKNCVYCRSGVWCEYNKKNNSEYINLI